MKIALVGNQNSGKTTLFNALTGMNAKIGNWPGVTIEKKTGKIKGTSHSIIDIPGIYSLSPYSIEEEVSRTFIFNEKPDIIINVVDATCIERSLYLTTQLLELDSKVIIALNMTDILEKKGKELNEKTLENLLGTRVIRISALKGIGISELINEVNKCSINILETYKNKKNSNKIYAPNIEIAIDKIENSLPIEIPHKRFVAVKIIENDIKFQNLINSQIKNIKNELNSNYKQYKDYEELIAEQRYEFIEMVKKQCYTEGEVQEIISDKIDKIILNKWLAFPIFFITMFLVYSISVGLAGKLTSGIIENFINKTCVNIEQVFRNIKVSIMLQSLVIDGIFAGVGAVLSFIPQLITLFTCISILETTGYMSRIALIFDKIFRKIGLSGKSIIPFIIGSGCSVPGIMGARIIENEQEKNITASLTSFIPCSAKLPIIVMFSTYFWKEKSGLISASLYFLSIAIIILSAIIIKKLKNKECYNIYISELPEYKLPSLKYVIKDVIDKTISFIRKAGSIILISSVIVWFLLSFSLKLEYGVNIENSILATMGKLISWVFYPMLGVNSWETAVSSIQGLVAKEQVISSMSIISGFSDMATNGNIFSKNGAFGFFTPISAYAFMLFNLFSSPCISAISAMAKEIGGVKKAVKVVCLQTIFAWILATSFYQVGVTITNGEFNLGDVLVVGIVMLVISLGKVSVGDNCAEVTNRGKYCELNMCEKCLQEHSGYNSGGF